MVTGVNNNKPVYTSDAPPSGDTTKVDPKKEPVPGGNFGVGNGTPPSAPGKPTGDSTGSGGVTPPKADGKLAFEALSVTWSTSTSTPILGSNMSLAQLREAMAALALKNRTDNLKTRDQELAASVKQQLAGVQKGLDAAKEQLEAARVAAAFQLAGAVVQIGFSAVALNSSIGTLTAKPPAVGLDAGAAASPMTRMQAFFKADPQALTAMGQAVSSAVNFPGTMWSENLKYDAATLTADQERFKVAGDKANSISQQSGERASSELQAFQAFLQGLQQAEQYNSDAAKRTFG
jgi:hypothetical protein